MKLERQVSAKDTTGSVIHIDRAATAFASELCAPPISIRRGTDPEGAKRLKSFVESHELGDLKILRPGQIPLMRSISDIVERNVQTSYIEASTGVGKGFCLVEAIKLLGERNLVLEPSRPLLRKLRKDMAVQAPLCSVGGIKELKSGIIKSNVVPCSYQFFLRQIEAGANWWQSFDRVWLDEGHLALSVRRQAAVKKLVCQGMPVIGLTFCGDYNDMKGLYHLLGPPAFRMNPAQSCAAGLTKPIEVYCVETDVDLSNIQLLSDGRYHPGQLDEALGDRRFNLANARFLKEACQGHQIIAFVAGVTQTKRQAEALEEVGMRAYAINGDDSSTEIDDKLKAFESGDVQVLVSADILTSGYHHVDTTVVADIAPTFSYNLEANRGGRIGGLIPNNPAQPGYILQYLHPDPRKRRHQVTYLDVLDGEIPVSPHKAGQPGIKRLQMPGRPIPGISPTFDITQSKEIIIGHRGIALNHMHTLRKTFFEIRHLYYEKLLLALNFYDGWEKLADIRHAGIESISESSKANTKKIIQEGLAAPLTHDQILALCYSTTKQAVSPLLEDLRYKSKTDVIPSILEALNDKNEPKSEFEKSVRARIAFLDDTIKERVNNVCEKQASGFIAEICETVAKETLREYDKSFEELDSEVQDQRILDLASFLSADAWESFIGAIKSDDFWYSSQPIPSVVAVRMQRPLRKVATLFVEPSVGMGMWENTRPEAISAILKLLSNPEFLEMDLEERFSAVKKAIPSSSFLHSARLLRYFQNLPSTEQLGDFHSDRVQSIAELRDSNFLERRDSVEQVIGHLPDLKARILKLRYGIVCGENPQGIEHTLVQTGAYVGLTKERVREIQREAENDLRGLFLEKIL